MLIDWVTARTGLDLFSDSDREKLRNLGDRIQRYNPKTGDQVWETSAWDSIRSDSHNISYRVGSDAFWMQGSPARVIGDGDAVFSSGASSALDLPGCVRSMRELLAEKLGVAFPSAPACWKVSRVDVTANLHVGSLPHVRQALRVLRDVEGGRYRVSQQAGDTVYWGGKSRLRKGKAYAKGPHLSYLAKKKDYDGREYTEEEVNLASGLLRLELTIGAQWWRERSGIEWFNVKADVLAEQWQSYFGRMIGNQEITEMNIEEKVRQVSNSEQQAKAAIRLWLAIKGGGWEQARNMMSKTTWYRYLKILRAAGLSDADLSVGNVVQFRRKMIELEDVNSWEELRRRAA